MMKKYLILFLTILAFAYAQKSIYAQSDSIFAPPNAEWWHDMDYGMRTNKIHSEVVGDTLIQNIIAKKIKQTKYMRTWLQNNTFTVDTFSPNYLYIYDAVDTVFVFNANFNRFTPLFVFNVNVGDTVCLPILGSQPDLRPNPIANGDTCFCFQIDSIATVLYDTTYLTTYFQHALFDSNMFEAWPVYNWCGDATGGVLEFTKAAYAKKIGGLFGGFLPQKLSSGIAKPTLDTIPNYYEYALRCYDEDSFAIHIFYGSNTNCYFDQPTGIAAIDPKLDFIKIYPNPNFGQLTLEASHPFGKNTSISISDLSGKTLKRWNASIGQSKISLSLKDLSSGMYLLKFDSDGRSLYKKVVVQKR